MASVYGTVGYLASHNLSVTKDEIAVKASAGMWFGGAFYNTHSSTTFLKFYNKGTIDPATDVPVITIPLEAATLKIVEIRGGIKFDTAISIRGTANVGDTEDTNPGAALVAEVFYC